MSLLVIVPSRGRPGHIAELWDAWRNTAAGVAELLVCLDDDDPTVTEYPFQPGIRYDIATRSGFAPRLSAVAAREARYVDAVASWTDKHRPRTEEWDRTLLDALTETPGIAYGDDTINGQWLPTACAVSSSVVTALGYLTPPELQHLYIDNFWRDLGTELDRLTYLPHIIIEHLHPAAGKGDWDALCLEANSVAAFERDEAAYLAYKTERFATDVEKVRAVL